MTTPPTAKRAPRPRTSHYAKSFVEDRERLSRTGRFDMRRLREAMLLLIANERPLGPAWRDHPLKGDGAGYRDCRIGGDVLLVYDVNVPGRIGFARAGTHTELFSE